MCVYVVYIGYFLKMESEREREKWKLITYIHPVQIRTIFSMLNVVFQHA